MLVCITGKIGSGKSTVTNLYKKIGYKTLEMDKYIHSIYKANKIGYQKIKNKFGAKYVNDKEVDRKQLGQLVFKNKKELDRLNAITLPLIKDKILSLQNQKEIVFIELGIYITNEQYFKDLFDLVILVKGKQGLTNQKLEQLSWHGKKSLVNWDIKLLETTNLLVIDNNSTIEDLKNKVKKSIISIKKHNKKIVEKFPTINVGNF